MAEAAYSYRNYASAAPSRVESAPERARAPRIVAVPGGASRSDKQIETLPELAVFAAKMLAVVIVVVALLCFARIGIANATVVTAMEAQAVDEALVEARSSAATLEMRQSTLGNPTRVKAVAIAIGMVDAANPETIVLPVDVVGFNAEGGLSLNESIRLATGTTR